MGIDTLRESIISHMDCVAGTESRDKGGLLHEHLEGMILQGSGLTLFVSDGGSGLLESISEVSHRAGRAADLFVLNLSRHSETQGSTFNPFTIGGADQVQKLLETQLPGPLQNDRWGVFKDRATALVGAVAPALVWLRDHKGVALNIEVIRFSIELRWIWKLAIEKVALLRDPATETVRGLDVNGEIPEDITALLRSYLSELPGYDPTLPLDQQKGDEPSKQHGYAQFYFTATFTQLAVSLGHIFRVETGDIDMRDVVLNRRILVVILPALAYADDTVASLCKLVAQSITNVCEESLGEAVGADAATVSHPGWDPARFWIGFQELSPRVTSAFSLTAARGGNFNIGVFATFADRAGLWVNSEPERDRRPTNGDGAEN
jgi:intracellular multiplication protein IcmO